MKSVRPNWVEVMGSLFIIAFCGVILIVGRNYASGSLQRIGPGLYPMLIGIVLLLFGFLLLAVTWKAPLTPLDIKVRPIVMATLSVMAFPAVAFHVGLIPATFAVVILAALAEAKMPVVSTLMSAVVLSVAAYLIFVCGLQLPLSPFWSPA